MNPFKFYARPTYVVDGDTMDVQLDLGFNLWTNKRLRLDAVDTAEIHGVDHDSEEYEKGMKHMSYVEQWLEACGQENWPIIVETQKTGKFGRYIAMVYRRSDGSCLNEDLIEAYPEVGYDSS